MASHAPVRPDRSTAPFQAKMKARKGPTLAFVLPNRTRATGNLLQTAKMLMACVPNGIQQYSTPAVGVLDTR